MTDTSPLRLLLATFNNRQQAPVIQYLVEENRVLEDQLGPDDYSKGSSLSGCYDTSINIPSWKKKYTCSSAVSLSPGRWTERW